MITKNFLPVLLSVAIAVPSGATSTSTSTSTGTVKGMVSMSGRTLEGLSLTLLNTDTGKSFAVRTSADGSFTATLPVGSYVFSSPGRAGIAIARAPLSLEIQSGKVASAIVELMALGAQGGTTANGSSNIVHDPFHCIPEDEFTLIEATFEPLSSVMDGRLYFQSNLSKEWFYTVFEKIEPFVLGGPSHRAFIPKVNKGGGITDVTYYLQVTASDFADTKSPENPTKVVADPSECKGRMAPIGTPAGSVAVLSALGAPAASIAGLGGIAGAGLGLGAVALAVAGGAVVVAGGVVVATNDATPTPTPTETTGTSTPTPTPTPTLTPTPVPLCGLTLITTPDTPADPSVGGPFCSAFVEPSDAAVSGTRIFFIPCNVPVTITARAAPLSSGFVTLPATWSNDCIGSALGAPCSFPSGLVTNRNVTLTCDVK